MLKFDDLLKSNKAMLLVGTALVMSGCGTSSDMPASSKALPDGTQAAAAPMENHNGTEYTSEDLNAQRLMRIASKAWQRGDAGTAMRLYAMAGQKDPDNADPALAMAKILRKTQKMDQALDLYKRIANRFPNLAEPHAGVGYVLLAQDKPYLAAKSFEIAVEMDPNNAKSLGGLALALDTAGEHEKAQGYYRHAIEKAPNNLTYQNNLALSLALSGRTEQAIALLKVVTAHPHSTAQHRQNLALVYGMAGKSEEALKYSRMDLNESAVQNNAMYFEALNGTSGSEQNSQSYQMAAQDQADRHQKVSTASEQETKIQVGATTQTITTDGGAETYSSSASKFVAKKRFSLEVARAEGAAPSPEMTEPVVAAAPTQKVASVEMMPPAVKEEPVAEVKADDRRQMDEVAYAAPAPKAEVKAEAETTVDAKVEPKDVAAIVTEEPVAETEMKVEATEETSSVAAEEKPAEVKAEVAPEMTAKMQEMAPAPAAVEVSYTMPEAALMAPKAEKPMIAAISKDRLYFVQLASFKTEERAQFAWREMSAANGDLLKAYEPIFAETDLGEEKGIYYRVRIGSFDNKTLADALCENLKANGQDCYLSMVKLDANDKVIADKPAGENAANRPHPSKKSDVEAVADAGRPLYPTEDEKARTTASIGY